VVGPVNIASGNPITLKDLVLTIGDKLNRPDLIRLGAIPARANDAPLVVADVGRLTNVVGWTPSHGLDSGLERTIEWWSDVRASQELAGR